MERTRLDTDASAETLERALAALEDDERTMVAACAAATAEDRAREPEDVPADEPVDGRF